MAEWRRTQRASTGLRASVRGPSTSSTRPATLGMWVFLVTEILFFGGMFTAYTIYRALHLQAFVTGSHLLDVKFGATNTAVLIVQQLDDGSGHPLRANRQEQGPHHLVGLS